jgi:hypothetical protein
LILLGAAAPASAGEKTKTYENRTWLYKISYPATWIGQGYQSSPDAVQSLDFVAASPDRHAAVGCLTFANPTGDQYIDLSSEFRQGFIASFLRSSGLGQATKIIPGTRRVHGHLYSSYDASLKDAQNNSIRMTMLLIAYPHHIYMFVGLVGLHGTPQHIMAVSFSRTAVAGPSMAQEAAEVQASLNSIVFE